MRNSRNERDRLKIFEISNILDLIKATANFKSDNQGAWKEEKWSFAPEFSH